GPQALSVPAVDAWSLPSIVTHCFSANVSLIHSRHRVRSSCRRSRRRGVRLPRQDSDPSHAVHKWASREGRGRMASGTRGQAHVAQLLPPREAGPAAVVGSTVAVRAWLVGTSPFSPRSTTHFGAYDLSSNVLPVDSCHVATRATIRAVRELLNSSLHHGATSKAECCKNLFSTSRVDHYLATRAPRGAVLWTGKVDHFVGATWIREWLPLTPTAIDGPQAFLSLGSRLGGTGHRGDALRQELGAAGVVSAPPQREAL